VTTFVAVYRGQTIAEAKLIAVSADPCLVAEVSSRILQAHVDESRDPVIARVDRGKNEALRLIKQEATEN
jgi:hypothetical protein